MLIMLLTVLAASHMCSRPVRVRFAPSPTGYLHIGGLRTALYNYLLARKHAGTFVLRIEDTDRERYVEDAETDITAALEWAGLSYDEGPTVGGDVGPYYQSARKELYQQYVQQLLDSGHAYYAFDTPETLDARREEAEHGFSYNAATRGEMENSLTLPDEEVTRRIAHGDPYVVRMKVAPESSIRFEDTVRGTVSFASEKVDDQVLLKSDGMPTYHLANVVDDHLMAITHVIRGEEWLPSTPKHILLYRYFGWEPPAFAHLPLILSPEGGKLSKRDAEALGIPVSVSDYAEAGYEPEALLNFLALLGWNPGTEEEVFSLEELAEAFSLDRVGSSGVQFDMDKLRWFNEQHLRALDLGTFTARVAAHADAHGLDDVDKDYLQQVCALMHERVSFAHEVFTESRYFFEAPTSYDQKGVKKRWKDDAPALLSAYAEALEALDTFTEATAEQTLRDIADAHDCGAGRIIHPTRLALSGVTFGPSLFAMMEVLGRATCVERMRTAIEELG